VFTLLDAEAAPALVRVLQSENTIAQSRAARAILSIARFGGKGQLEKLDIAIEPLARLLKDREQGKRINELYAMSALGPKAIPHLIEQLDADEYTQAVMREGFIRHGERVVEPLSDAVRTGNATTRRNAAQMLGFIAWRAPEALPAMERQALGPLTEAVDDDDPLAREAALNALGQMGARAKPALARIFASLQRPDALFVPIAKAVRDIGPEAKQLDALLSAAGRAETKRDPERPVWAFGEAIAAAGEAAVEPAITALDDDHERVRKTAMYALLYLGPKAAPAVPKLIELLNDGDQLAAQTLGAIGPGAEDAAVHLIRRLEHDDPRGSRSAISISYYSINALALAGIGKPALPAVLEGLEHEKYQVRAGCLAALKSMDREVMAPVSKIEPLLRDERPILRGLALQALIKHADTATIKPILERLVDDPHGGVARYAKSYLDKLELAKE
jgi:HEAT repeat protein